MNIDMQKLLVYTKEELATYILKYCFSDKNKEAEQFLNCTSKDEKKDF